jgi:hypothetical protein
MGLIKHQEYVIVYSMMINYVNEYRLAKLQVDMIVCSANIF